MIKRLWAQGQDFEHGMSRLEIILAFVWFPFHWFIVPAAATVAVIIITVSYDAVLIEFICKLADVVYLFIVLRRYLRRAFDGFLDNLKHSFSSAGIAYVIIYVLSIFATFAVNMIIGDAEANPNEEAWSQLQLDNPAMILVITVVLAPIGEECMFRGALFGTLRRKSRWLAYAVTVVVFSSAHVIQYVVLYGDWSMTVYLLQYIPMAIGLAWCYERSGTIWSPIILHVGINALAMLAG